jgi:hypothetical protein
MPGFPRFAAIKPPLTSQQIAASYLGDYKQLPSRSGAKPDAFWRDDP